MAFPAPLVAGVPGDDRHGSLAGAQGVAGDLGEDEVRGRWKGNIGW